jgi:hypothetical protein
MTKNCAPQKSAVFRTSSDQRHILKNRKQLDQIRLPRAVLLSTDFTNFHQGIENLEQKHTFEAPKNVKNRTLNDVSSKTRRSAIHFSNPMSLPVASLTLPIDSDQRQIMRKPHSMTQNVIPPKSAVFRTYSDQHRIVKNRKSLDHIRLHRPVLLSTNFTDFHQGIENLEQKHTFKTPKNVNNRILNDVFSKTRRSAIHFSNPVVLPVASLTLPIDPDQRQIMRKPHSKTRNVIPHKSALSQASLDQNHFARDQNSSHHTRLLRAHILNTNTTQSRQLIEKLEREELPSGVTKRVQQIRERWIREFGLSHQINLEQIISKFHCMVIANTSTKRWRWSTVQTNLGHLIGALQSVGMIHVSRTQPMKGYIRWIDQKVASEMPNYPEPLKKENVHKILTSLKGNSELDTFAFTILCWISCQRPGCVYALQVRNVQITDDVVTMLFVEGKAVRSLGQPFCVHASAGQWRNVLKSYIAKRHHQTFLFDQHQKQSMYRRVRALYRSVQPLADIRSSRRGAIETLAKRLNVSQLRRITMHKSDEMLMRYLRWGTAAKADFEDLIEATRTCL